VKKYLLLLLVFLIFLSVKTYACTIGIIRADLTESGRPMIWKTRDSSNNINYPVYDDSGLYSFIGLTHTTNPAQTWAGVNNVGFAILNALSLDLEGPSGLENGILITYALKSFATITEFEAYLDATASPQRRLNGNFAVIDALGNGAMYEIASTTYYKYDVNTAENGYIVRTNFSLVANGDNGVERYARSNAIIESLVNTNTFSVQNLINTHFRDFSDEDAVPFPIPYMGSTNGHAGYIRINVSICNHISTSSQVIEGINSPDQIPVMWTLAGFPAVTPAIPFVPAPFEFDSTLISTLSQEIKGFLVNIPNTIQLMNTQYFYLPNNEGIWDRLRPFEADVRQQYLNIPQDSGFYSAYSSWLPEVYANAIAMMNDIKEYFYASEVEQTLPAERPFTIYTYPNPNYGSFKIGVNWQVAQDIVVEIFNIKGQLIHRETHPKSRDISTATFTISDKQPNGVYIIRVSDNEAVASRKVLKLSR